MNVLVIDDEYYIVQGIINNLDKEELGIDEVYAAYSAQQGRQILQSKQVDILLVDVEMPIETGLELLEWMRQNHYRTTTIVISGHQRFDYAQAAILYHCFHYLLKPISKTTLNHEVGRAIRFVQYKDSTPILSPEEPVDSKESEFVVNIRKYISEHFSDPQLSRTSIAVAMHMNPDYLSYCFHKDFNKTLTTYITEFRIDHAKYLLRNSKFSVVEICEQCGYSNIPYFYKQFKKLTGITPQQYRG